MNLILSDVEETIMLVDGAEGTPHGQGVVNVSSVHPLIRSLFLRSV
jgi:small nuclear ribonucleoprotein (snRNP)-like protein